MQLNTRNNKAGTLQHWVTQWLQRAWSVSTTRPGKVFVFDKRENAVRGPSSTRNFCGARGHFDLPDSVAPGATVDDTFTDFESRGMAVIEKIREATSLACLLAPRRRRNLYQFVSALRHASMAARNSMPEFHRAMLRQKPDAAERYGVDDSDDHARAVFAATVVRAPMIEERVLRKKHLVLRHSPSGSYVLGDNPVVCFNVCATSPVHSIGLALDSTEVALPISPHYMLYFGNPWIGTSERVFEFPAHDNHGIFIDDENTSDVLNFIQLNFAERHVIIPSPLTAKRLEHFLELIPDAARPPRWITREEADAQKCEEN